MYQAVNGVCDGEAPNAMKIQDHTSAPCKCLDCQQAGVSDRPQIRDPQTGENLHGYRLKRYHAAADAALARIRRTLARMGDA